LQGGDFVTSRITLRHCVYIGAVLGLSSLACQVTSGINPLVWNQDAHLGETVAMPFASNGIYQYPLVPDESGSGTPGLNVSRVSKENVTVRLKVNSTTYVEVAPDAVIESSASRSSEYASLFPGTWMTMVVFTVPANLPITPPKTVGVSVKVDGINDVWPGGSISIADGTIGTPTNFYAPLDQLENPPMLRVRSRTGTGKFPTDCVIGSIQFDLAYPSSVADPAAYVNSEAYLAMVRAYPTGSGTARVVLVSPDGFTLPDPDGNGVSGTGPIIDIAFTKNAPFAVTDFHLNNLVVTNTDGSTCVNQPNQDSTAAFQLNVIRGS
jgi:hypothetical protein